MVILFLNYNMAWFCKSSSKSGGYRVGYSKKGIKFESYFTKRKPALEFYRKINFSSPHRPTLRVDNTSGYVGVFIERLRNRPYWCSFYFHKKQRFKKII